jgi:anti-sigma regulatory factor (Ser/Thr protein kinase)
VAQTLEEHFTEVGWRPVVVAEPVRGEQAARQHGIRLAIVDYALRGAQRLVDGLKLHPQTNPVPIAALFPTGQDPEHPQALRVQADIELPEPVDMARLLAASETQVARTNYARAEFRVRFILPSTQEDLDRAGKLAATLLHHSRLEGEGQARVVAAFREAVGNAIQHGNQADPKRMVRGEYRCDDHHLSVTVEDEGPGFDYETHLRRARKADAAEAARRRHQEGGLGGLGLVMICRCADHVEFNAVGTRLTFSKRIPATAAQDPAKADAAAARANEGRG